ncbi:MAG: inactive transglutaminase family protein [Deltaproteobacteria bacterium]|nr:inactive transglutaminase family protein [Deltaproteobacteria bacterium]
MSRAHFFVVVALLSISGLALFFYKALVLDFPLQPDVTAPLWNIEARVTFIGRNRPIKVSLHIPRSSMRAVVMDESFISSGYGLTTTAESPNRTATWSIRKAYGRQNLYYKAVLRELSVDSVQGQSARDPLISEHQFEGAELAAAQAWIADATSHSADTDGLVLAILRGINEKEKADYVKLLLGRKVSDEDKSNLVVKVLAQGGVAARTVHGIRLVEDVRDAPILHWIEVFNKVERTWDAYDITSSQKGVPEDYFPWWRNDELLVNISGGSDLSVDLAVGRNQELAITSAMEASKFSNRFLLDFSLFSLPIQIQYVYRILVMIPLGALVIVVIRNMVGLVTFGTFMPVLIALAFRETELLWGIALFVLVVSLGLAIRFYLEHLKLLLVPRLAAVLSVVILLMIVLSIITHRLELDRGLSIALFPMVIITMTIERMSIIWEEQGGRKALTNGVGSLIAASLCYLVMSYELLEHIFFVFPELLLVVLAINILVGRYTGYRLFELFRFKAFAEQEV